MKRQTRYVPIVVPSLVTILWALTLSGSPRVAMTPCRADSDTSAHALFALKQLFGSQGADSSSLSLVTDSTKCQAVIDSYNADVDSTMRATSAYVFSGASTYALYLPAVLNTAFKSETVYLFDTSYSILVRMNGVR